MKRSILVGASALAVAVGMLASGFIAGRPQAATVGADPLTLAAAETASPGRLEMEGHRGSLRVLHEPRQTFSEGERRMIDNPKKHGRGPQRIKVVTAGIRHGISGNGVG